MDSDSKRLNNSQPTSSAIEDEVGSQPLSKVISTVDSPVNEVFEQIEEEHEGNSDTLNKRATLLEDDQRMVEPGEMAEALPDLQQVNIKSELPASRRSSGSRPL